MQICRLYMIIIHATNRRPLVDGAGDGAGGEGDQTRVPIWSPWFDPRESITTGCCVELAYLTSICWPKLRLDLIFCAFVYMQYYRSACLITYKSVYV